MTEDARVICIGTPFHQEDFYARLSASPAWETRRFPVEDDAGNPRWPERAAIRVIDFKTGRDKMSLEWQTEALAAESERGQ